MGQQNIINRSTSTSSNKYVPDIEPGMKEFAVVGNAAAQVGKKLGGNSSLWDWMSKGFGWLFGGGASNVINPNTFTSTGFSSTRKISKPSGGGLGGFIKNIFSSGDSMMGAGSLLTGIGGAISAFTDRSDEFKERELDIYEELGREGIRINEMKAKDAIRQTGLSTMYMGWTPKQADVPGIFEGTPGLVVGNAPTEVASNTGGFIGGSNQGMITQAKQRQV